MGITLVSTNFQKNSTFVSPTYTFFLVENILADMPRQGTNREKYFYEIDYKGGSADSGMK